MIRAAIGYFRGECLPHWRALVFDSQIPLSAIAVIAAMYYPGISIAFTIKDLTQAALAYGSISFGFAITIYTLALMLPQPETVRLLSAHREDGEPTDAYRKLLFVFSWTAITQGCLVIVAFVGRLALPPDSTVFRQVVDIRADVLPWLIIFVLAYAVLQFLNAVFAVAQLGRIVARKNRDQVIAEQQRSALTPVKKNRA
jgi:hypothetical protein